MPVYYLLECSCGVKVPVTASQAGQTIQCSCGQELEVPTLLKLRQLEAFEEESTTRTKSEPSSPNNWGLRQGLMTAGVVATFFAMVWLTFVMINKPLAPKEKVSDTMIERRIEHMNLLETFAMWNSALRFDIRQKMIADFHYLAELKKYHIRFGVAIVLVLAGFGMIGTTFIFTRRATSRGGTH